MLNRSKLLREVQQHANLLFVDHHEEMERARTLWQKIINDPLLPYKIKAATTAFAIPEWKDALNSVATIDQTISCYTAASVDGSQIYPDRHQGINCYLINIGSVAITYGVSNHGVYLNSEPHIFSGNEEEERVTPDVINCRRDEFEFAQGLGLSETQKKLAGVPYALLFDGALIFWQLEAKDQTFKQQFLQTYFSSMMGLYESATVMGSYVSMPKTKEVSNLLRLALCNFNTLNCEDLTLLEHVHDATIMHWLLKPYQRSTIFKHTGSLAQLYPDPLKPHFFYLHVGNEIARIEIPAWIAQNDLTIMQLCQIIIDQCAKGNGYPVVLAEAHEQAVIKGPDREFFYHVIAKIGVDKKQRLIMSQKSLKKRGIGI